MDIVNVPIASVAQYIFGLLMFFTSLFLILLVLVQRGRGGGLAGAFGGMGGQSAFGTKAGDLFTRLTMGAAAFWIVLCVLAISVLNRQSSPLGGAAGASPLDAIEGELRAPLETTPSDSTGLPDAFDTLGLGSEPAAEGDTPGSGSGPAAGGDTNSATTEENP